MALQFPNPMLAASGYKGGGTQGGLTRIYDAYTEAKKEQMAMKAMNELARQDAEQNQVYTNQQQQGRQAGPQQSRNSLQSASRYDFMSPDFLPEDRSMAPGTGPMRPAYQNQLMAAGYGPMSTQNVQADASATRQPIVAPPSQQAPAQQPPAQQQQPLSVPQPQATQQSAPAQPQAQAAPIQLPQYPQQVSMTPEQAQAIYRYDPRQYALAQKKLDATNAQRVANYERQTREALAPHLADISAGMITDPETLSQIGQAAEQAGMGSDFRSAMTLGYKSREKSDPAMKKYGRYLSAIARGETVDPEIMDAMFGAGLGTSVQRAENIWNSRVEREGNPELKKYRSKLAALARGEEVSASDLAAMYENGLHGEIENAMQAFAAQQRGKKLTREHKKTIKTNNAITRVADAMLNRQWDQKELNQDLMYIASAKPEFYKHAIQDLGLDKEAQDKKIVKEAERILRKRDRGEAVDADKIEAALDAMKGLDDEAYKRWLEKVNVKPATMEKAGREFRQALVEAGRMPEDQVVPYAERASNMLKSKYPWASRKIMNELGMDIESLSAEQARKTAKDLAPFAGLEDRIEADDLGNVRRITPDGSVELLREPIDLPEGVPPEGETVYGQTQKGTGLKSWGIDFLDRTLGQFTGLTNEQVQKARQDLKFLANKYADTLMSGNTRAQSEKERWLKIIDIEPSVFDSPAALEARMYNIRDYLNTQISRNYRDAKESRDPDVRRNAENRLRVLTDIKSDLGVPKRLNMEDVTSSEQKEFTGRQLYEFAEKYGFEAMRDAIENSKASKDDKFRMKKAYAEYNNSLEN